MATLPPEKGINPMRRCGRQRVHNVRNPLRLDPTRTITLRRKFAARVRAMFGGLKNAIRVLVLDEDALGLRPKRRSPLLGNTRWQFHTTPQKLQAFQDWLKGQMAERLTGRTEENQWRQFIEQGFARGAGRAFDDARRFQRALVSSDPVQVAGYEGSRDEFLRSAFALPETVEKVQLLAGRTLDELRNVTSDMGNRMARVLADGLVRGANPREIARDLAAQVDVGRERALLISRTEIIRAHAEGQLEALERLGVASVGVAVEWATAGDHRVCRACESLEGVVLSLDEARGLIPRHPNCRCAFLPANVGEDSKTQVATKGAIDEAVEQSVEADGGVDATSWVGADLAIPASRPQSIFNEESDDPLAAFSQWVLARLPGYR